MNEYYYPIERIDLIESEFDAYIAERGFDAAADLMRDIQNYVREKKQDGLSEELEKRYLAVWAKAAWMVLERLSPQQAKTLFKEYFLHFFAENLERRIEQIQGVIHGIALDKDKDQFKQELRSIIENSEFVFSTPIISGSEQGQSRQSLAGLMRDFRNFTAGQSLDDPLLITEYLNNHPSTRGLADEVYQQLEQTLKFFVYMTHSATSAEGNVDVDVYHDVYTGTVHVMRAGKNYDTGIPSEVIAKLTPQQRTAMQQYIEKDLELLRSVNLQEIEQGNLSSFDVYQERKRTLDEELAKTLQQKNTEVVISSTETREQVSAVQHSLQGSEQLVDPAPTPTTAPTPTASSTSTPAPIPVTPAPEPAAPPKPATPPSAPTPTIAPIPEPTPAPAPAPQPKKSLKRRFDPMILAQQVLSDHALLLGSLEVENRFLSLVSAYAQQKLTQKEAFDMLVTPAEQGGIGLQAQIAQSVMHSATELAQHPEQIRARNAKAAHQDNRAGQPTFAQVQEMMERQKKLEEEQRAQSASDNPDEASAPSSAQNVEDIFANLGPTHRGPMPLPNQEQTADQQPPASVKVPLVRRIDKQNVPVNNGGQSQATAAPQPKAPRVMGPLEELQHFSLNEFRSFHSISEATEHVLDIINRLGQQSVAKRAEGIRAWQQSPVNQLYVHIGNASLQQGMPVNEYIGQQQQIKPHETLTLQEFDAVTKLNRQIRF